MFERATVDLVTGCWIWTGAKSEDGYGRIGYVGRTWLTHRLAYSITRGPVPPTLVMDHLCRRRDCINPEHLEAVTYRENVVRGTGFAAKFAAQTHCKRGHLFDAANTYFPKRGGRDCRACKRLRDPAKTRRGPYKGRVVHA